MPRLLNPEHEMFAHYFVSGPYAGSYVAAYEAAGFARDTGNASRLARQPEVAARIAELQKGVLAAERHDVRKALAEAGVDRPMLVRQYAALARANPLDYYTTDERGRAEPHLSRLDREKGLALRELSIDTGRDGAPRMRFKLYDRHRAMAKLEKAIEFSQEVPALPAAPLPAPPDQDRLIAMICDFAARQDEEEELALARQAIAAARKTYPDGKLTLDRLQDDALRACAAKAAAEKAQSDVAAKARAAADARAPTEAHAAAEAHDSSGCHSGVSPVAVMPALVAGIHALSADAAKQGVDGRDKPGHDDTIASENLESHNSASCHSGGEQSAASRSGTSSPPVVTGLVPVTPLREAPCPPKRDGRDTGERSDAVLSNGYAGHDEAVRCDHADVRRELSAGRGQFSLYDHAPGSAGDT